ncbi:YbbR domain-containing protein [Pilibacter termitis]|uniref:YbbR domain-containing protein n=1 Tax=Pilibacter termitis TaxID=263852 RepID=A0A1T4Q019_9ENTE|nr:CdaR family protein [Pilibacter termitis]SJZ97069.1 YbbR domain-containing protein [Pilibacter termitis]
MKDFMNSKPFYLVLSLLLAILLFFNANSMLKRNSAPNEVQGEMFNADIHSVPIQLKYDTSKYYVSGYNEEASVYLSSYNRVRLDAERNEATRTFTLEADLSKKNVGTYDIPVRIVGLSNAVTADVEPKTISVTIEKKETKMFPVKVNVPESQIKEGYTMTDTESSPQKVEITTGSESMKLIDHIEAVLPKDLSLDHDYTGEVGVRAVDKNGQEINIVARPQVVNATIHVLAPSKTVDILPTQAGVLPKDVLQYNFTLSTHTVEISGSPEELAKIDVIHLPIKIDGITETTKKLIPINQDLYSVTPSSIEVTIEPVKKPPDNTTNSSAGNSSSQKSTQGSSQSSTTTTTSKE